MHFKTLCSVHISVSFIVVHFISYTYNCWKMAWRRELFCLYVTARIFPQMQCEMRSCIGNDCKPTEKGFSTHEMHESARSVSRLFVRSFGYGRMHRQQLINTRIHSHTHRDRETGEGDISDLVNGQSTCIEYQFVNLSFLLAAFGCFASIHFDHNIRWNIYCLFFVIFVTELSINARFLCDLRHKMALHAAPKSVHLSPQSAF